MRIPKNPLTVLTGLGVGAAIMYFLDPERGDRRRHIAYDKTRKGLRVGGRELHGAAENAKNHAIGAAYELKAHVQNETPEDARLADRVRAELGHHVEHPRAIEVFAENGCITLCGAVAPDEMASAVQTVASVPGVRTVDNQLIAQSER